MNNSERKMHTSTSYIYTTDKTKKEEKNKTNNFTIANKHEAKKILFSFVLSLSQHNKTNKS